MKKMKYSAAITILAALLLSLAACKTEEPAVVWDARLVEQFKPTEAMMQEMKTEIQEVNVESVCGDVTLKVGQTLGNEKDLCIVLDIGFSDGVPLQDMLLNGTEMGEDDRVEMGSIRLYSGKITYDEIVGMPLVAVSNKYRDREESFNCYMRTEGPDLERNTIPFLVGFEAGTRNTLPQGEVTLFIEDITLLTGGEERLLGEGPFVISWNLENAGEVETFILRGEGEAEIGRGYISPFSICVELDSSDYSSMDEFADTVKIILETREDLDPRGSSGGNYESPNGKVEYSVSLREMLDMNTVRGVRAGDNVIIFRQ